MTARLRRLRRARLHETTVGQRETHRVFALASVGAAASAATLLLSALLIVCVWPRRSEAKANGFFAAAKAQAKESIAALRTLTLPEFVARIAVRLESEGVPARVAEGGTSLLLGAPKAQFARSREGPLRDSKKDLEAFSRALAWGMECYVTAGGTRDACGKPIAVNACEAGFAPFRFKGLSFEGHADAVPFRAPSPTRNNEALSLARAENAREIVDGCLGDQRAALLDLEAKGLGTRAPAVEPGTAAENRRVEVKFEP